MADKTRKTSLSHHKYAILFIRYSAVLIPSMVAFFLFLLFLLPVLTKFLSTSRMVAQKQSDIVTAERSTVDVAKMKEDLERFRKTVVEFEKRLPKRMKTTLTIETLQEITEKSRLKFASLEPLPLKKYIIPETGDVFIEVPIRVRLNCGYYDLIEFLKNIETAGQLMKVADLTIRRSAVSPWEHAIEFSISAYSQGASSD